jgi:hypothetical protein
MIWIPPNERDPGISTLTTPGFVYFIQGGLDGPIKIGWATKPERRRANMESYSPELLSLLHFEPGTGRDERALHKQFKCLRKHGEWFTAGPDLKAYINGRAGKDVFWKPSKRRIAL